MLFNMGLTHLGSEASNYLPVDSILEAVLTVSPNKQYLGIVIPTTPAQQGPTEKILFNIYKNIYLCA